NEIMEQARRTIEETFGKESATPPSAKTTPSQPKSQQDLVDEIRRKLDRLSGKRGETETAARQPPATTPNEVPRTPVSRPDLSTTSCRINRPYLAAIAACDDVINRYPDVPEAYFVRGWARNQGREYGR